MLAYKYTHKNGYSWVSGREYSVFGNPDLWPNLSSKLNLDGDLLALSKEKTSPNVVSFCSRFFCLNLGTNVWETAGNLEGLYSIGYNFLIFILHSNLPRTILYCYMVSSLELMILFDQSHKDLESHNTNEPLVFNLA